MCYALNSGADLLSPQGVSSVLVGLTAEFGMESGVTPPPKHQN